MPRTCRASWYTVDTTGDQVGTLSRLEDALIGHVDNINKPWHKKGQGDWSQSRRERDALNSVRTERDRSDHSELF